MTKTLQPRIEELERLDKARTQGEWILQSYPMSERKPAGITCNNELVCAFELTKMTNAKFIVAAPEMMQIIYKLHALIKQAEGVLQQCDGAMDYMSEYDIPICLPGDVKEALAAIEKAGV